jgi:hypothetical protein
VDRGNGKRIFEVCLHVNVLKFEENKSYACAKKRLFKIIFPTITEMSSKLVTAELFRKK